jgi:hypothetical protein
MSSDQKPARENLEGWIPDLATPDEIRSALEKAFDYRGDVTITLRSGERIEGYIFDRRSGGHDLAQCWVRIFPRDRNEKVSLPYSEITRLEFSGRDTAAGKTFASWIQRYRERKALGEKNISLDPEPLDRD